jgi:hypothetical protein
MKDKIEKKKVKKRNKKQKKIAIKIIRTKLNKTIK